MFLLNLLIYIIQTNNPFKFKIIQQDMTKEERPFYETEDKQIAFFQNPNDGPSGYDVKINNDYAFCIPDRTLQDLTRPGTDRVMGSLEAITSGRVRSILAEGHISPEKLHIALLQLKLREQELELERAYSKVEL